MACALADRHGFVARALRAGGSKEDRLHIYTVAYRGHALAVVRAVNEADAVGLARKMILPRSTFSPEAIREQFTAHEPSHSEMLGWLEKRTDYLLTEGAGYVLANLLEKY